MATLGTETIDVVLPDGVSTDDVAVSKGPEGNDLVVVKNNVSGLKIDATAASTGITGKRVSDSTVSAKPSAGETAKVVVETSTFKDNTISNDGAGSLEVNVLAGKFKGSTIESGKSADSVSFGGSVKVKSAELSLGKGNDSVTFKGKKVKGDTTIDLGKGGKDVVVFENAKAANNVTITNITAKDKFTVGGETYTGKEVKNGADVGFEVG